MALTTPTVSKAFSIDSDSATWDLTDTTTYTSFGLVSSEVKGNFRLESPAGVIHDNVDFTMPDTTSADREYSQALTVASDNLPVFGAYSHIYTIQVTKAVAAVLDGAPGVGYFQVSGDRVDDITASGMIEISGSVDNDDSFAVQSVTLVSGNTRVFVTGTINPVTGALGSLIYQLEGAEDEYEFYLCRPEMEIEQTVDCESSILQSLDVTDYNITFTGQYTALAYDSIARTHVLRYPQGITPPPADITGAGALLVAQPIYTKTWTTILTTELVYTLPSGLILNYTAEGTKEINVECTAELCGISTCIQNVNDNYIEALRTNPKQVELWGNRLMKVLGGYIVYSIGVRCGDGEKREEGLAQINAVAKATNCSCQSESNSNLPQLVVPIVGLSGVGGSATTTIVTTTSNGITVSAAVVGSTVTYTLSLEYSILVGNMKASNAQVFTGTVDNLFVTPAGLLHKFNNPGFGLDAIVVTDAATGAMEGETKNTAFNKDFGVDPGDVPEIGATLGVSSRVLTDASGKLITSGASDPYEVLFSDVGDVGNAANNAELTLYTYTLPGGTLSVDNDWIEVSSDFTMVPSGGNTIWARLYFGGTNIFAGGTALGYTQVSLKYRVERTGAATQLMTGESQYKSSTPSTPSDLFRNNYANPGETLANPIVIRCTGQSVTAATANQVIAKNLTVTIHRQ